MHQEVNLVMKIIAIHTEGISYTVREKAISDASDIKEKEFSTDTNIIVFFTSVEKADEELPMEQLAAKAVNVLASAAKEVSETNLMVYPFVHLSDTPSSPSFARKTITLIYEGLKARKDFDHVYMAPFGYYKGFSLKCLGHPLAERLFVIKLEEDEFTKKLVAEDAVASEEDLTALKAEEMARSYFKILTPEGELYDIADYKFTKDEENFKAFVSYEIAKDRTSKTQPPHIKLMKHLELADYEVGTDPGNFRFPPRGLILKRNIEERVTQYLLDYGAHVIQTPLFYDFEHPALKKYLERFPARQYVVKSGKKNYFLRFSACFGQFLSLSQAPLSYKQLPVKVFELASSFRREQSGEISGLRRLRGFIMPDMHSLSADIKMAQQLFKEQYELSTKMMKDFELDYEIAFRVQEDFFNENKDWVVNMLKLAGKKALLELFKERYAYFILKFEFNFVDTQRKAAALSTVQIDVENGERFNIVYVNEKGEQKHPYILHCSLSGSVERVLYAMLEKASKQMRKGETPMLPFWLSPVHVRIVPLEEEFLSHAKDLAQQIKNVGGRVEIDDRFEMTLNKRIRNAEVLWIPYIIVLGKKEISENTVSVRKRGVKKQETTSVPDFIQTIQTQLEGYPRVPSLLPLLVSKQVKFIQFE